MTGDSREKLMEYTRQKLSDKNRYIQYAKTGKLLTNDMFADGDDISINYHLKEANMKNHLHGHDFFELSYVLKGSCQETFENGDQLTLTEGSLCILNPNAKHAMNIESNEDIVLNILMKQSLFNTTFWSLIGQHEHIGPFFLSYFMSQDMSSNYLVFHSELTDDLQKLADRICSEYIDRPLYYKVTLRCLLVIFFTEIIRWSNLQSEEHEFTSKVSMQLTALFQYLSTNFAAATLKSTAAYFHYHPNYLSAFIKKHTHKNFRTILNEIKLSHATYYLTNTNMPIKAISEQLGFSQLCNFYDFIKKAYGTTPVRYRQMHSGNIPPVDQPQ